MDDMLYMELDSFMKGKINSVDKDVTRIDLDLKIVCQRDKNNMLRFFVVSDDYVGITHRVKFSIEKEKKE